jgi:hypothetical protein
MLPLALLLPPLCAAPLRVALNAPALPSLLAGFIATGLLAVMVSKQLPPPRLTRAKALAVALVSIAACAALYSRTFAGLPAWIGSDSGNHAALLRSGNVHAYEGFFSMYLLWDLVEQLTCLDSFHAFALVFYGEIVLLAALPLAISFATLRVFEGTRAWTAGVVASTLAALASLGLVVLPLVHYFQVEGFWTQLFALVPLVLIWWLDVILAEGWQRIFVWGAGLVLMRYTYGLNLVELLVAFACVAVIDAPRRWRIPLAALSLVSLVGAGMAHARFASVVRMWGWFLGYDLKRALGAGQLALAALVLAALGELFTRRAIARALRVPVLLGVGSFTITVYHLHRFKPSYYIFKYPFQAICLLSLAGCVMLGYLAAVLVERRGWRVLAWGGVCLGLFGWAVALWFATFSEYHFGYVERLVGRPPHVLRPLADLEAWRRIEALDAREKKKFGGYLVSFGPMSNFMNSAMGIGNGQSFYFQGKSPKMDPGYCVFWDGTQPDPWPEFDRWYRHRPLAQRLGRERNAKCEDYPAPWDGSKRRLCHLCR